ncbi:uncharacterized protein LOC124269074 isoform X4 [Haliotis rubra]|uniref:uncharacterized protein LOC124269074 isoform X4 n=1 Tax=Haliotis rubra TaxID=36100 RepID=UPI001EE50C7A|nr:uncharacterized protein LOC124269074 isoform X4 [Haliotis rubra]
MAVFTDINRDKYGVVRGRCKDCPEECPQYSQPVLRHNCTYCGCPAGNHERVERRPEPIIKTEPGEEEARSPGRRDGGPTPGPSRRPDGSTTHRNQSRTVIQIQAQPAPSRRNRSPIVSRTLRDPWGIVTQKRCKTLFESESVDYSQLERHLSKTDHGVFTILWKGEILYVGEPKKTPILSNLRCIFTGGSSQDISKCLKGLPRNLVQEHVRVAWIKHVDDDPHLKTCREGKKRMSYRQCLSNLQARKPRDVLRGLMQSTSGILMC